MSWYSKVAWKEGLFLQPHHLQQNDRYVEKLIEARTRTLSPYPWGIEEMRVNRDRLQQGRIELATVSGGNATVVAATHPVEPLGRVGSSTWYQAGEPGALNTLSTPLWALRRARLSGCNAGPQAATPAATSAAAR